MSAGGSRHYVAFYSPTPSTDGAGQSTLGYVLQFSAPVDFLVMSSRKSMDGDIQPSGSDVAQIRMPFTTRVKVNWRVRYDDTDWDVRTIRDPNGRRRDLEITVERVEQ